VDRDGAVALYAAMLRSRTLDDFVEERLAAGDAAPHFHSGTGQEALTVGAALALTARDKLLYTHRGYGQLLARGLPLSALLRDLLCRTGGTNDGFGSVLHVHAPELGLPGREGVFGTRFTIGAGLALAERLAGSEAVVLCFYGEAAGSRGPLYEALNLAVLWALPLVLVAENNGFSVSSRTGSLYPRGRMSAVWRGFGIPVAEVDGNDAEEVWSAVSDAVGHAREGRGPAIVEGLTYRVAPHIPGDREAEYREPWEARGWARRDPLAGLAARLEDRGWLTAEARAELARGLRAEVEEAWRDAVAAPPPGRPELEARLELLR
jgi:pyruvate dehydrogenase E1 component alpha subunit